MSDFSDPIQQDVWNTVRAMNDAWTKGDPDDLAGFFHANMVALTPMGRERVVGREACLAGWKGFCANAHIHRWEEIDPQVRVYGDAAVVTYYYDLDCDMDGHTINLSGRDMFFLVKEAGKWWAVADQFSSFPER
jgi:hypothetical protein